MRRLPLTGLALRRRRRMLISLALGLFAFELLIGVVARAVPAEQLFSSSGRAPRAFQAFSGSGGRVSLASYAGLLGAGLVHPVWIALHLTAIASLTAAVVAADVEAGTIELIAVRPLSRRRLLAERTLAVVVAAVVLHLVDVAALLTSVLTAPRLRAQIGPAGVASAGVMGLGLSLCVIGPAIAVSAAGRHRAQVVTTAVCVGVVGFALDFLALAWAPAAPVRWLSPFHYYRPADALVAGAVRASDLAVLVAVFAAGLLAADRLLARRDLTP